MSILSHYLHFTINLYYCSSVLFHLRQVLLVLRSLRKEYKTSPIHIYKVNKMSKKLIYFLAALVLQTSICGCTHIVHQKHATPLSEAILGTWKLDSFVRITPEKKEIPWCKGANGFLTYTNQNYMSAAINCTKDTPEDAPSHPYNNMLLYTATYQVSGNNTVTHHILNCSQLDLIGKDLLRNAEFTENTMTLTGNSGRGDFRIVWKKL